jgi:hypothetical protein
MSRHLKSRHGDLLRQSYWFIILLGR